MLSLSLGFSGALLFLGLLLMHVDTLPMRNLGYLGTWPCYLNQQRGGEKR